MQVDYRKYNWCTVCRNKVPKKVWCDECKHRTRWKPKFVQKERKKHLVKARI